MTEEKEKKRRGRPPEGERAMTPAERQQRARMRRARSPKWQEVDRARAEIQAQNWPLARIEEAFKAMDGGDERDQLLRCCQALWDLRARALTALKKAGLGTR